MLSTCSPWGRKESDTTEWRNWTECLYPGLPVLFSPSVVSTCLQPHGRSTPGFLVLHHLLKCAQTLVHRVGDAIQPSHLLSSPSPDFSLSRHQNLFQWAGSSHQVAKVLELQLQHQSFQWTFMDSLILSFLNSLTTLSSSSIYFIPCITVSIWYCFWRFPEGSFKHQNLHLSTTFPNPPLTSGWEWWR